MKFVRRTSAGSSPASAAKRSIARSIACAASGRPAPRIEVVGVVLVTTDTVLVSIFGIAYTPLDIKAVRFGRYAPRAGYAPASPRTSIRYASSRPSRVPPSVNESRCAAAVREPDHVLGARLGPSHGPSELAREPRDEHSFGLDHLRAEPAAHVRAHDAHLPRVEPEEARDDHLARCAAPARSSRASAGRRRRPRPPRSAARAGRPPSAGSRARPRRRGRSRRTVRRRAPPSRRDSRRSTRPPGRAAPRPQRLLDGENGRQ